MVSRRLAGIRSMTLAYRAFAIHVLTIDGTGFGCDTF
jgi:hypothetical protein